MQPTFFGSHNFGIAVLTHVLFKSFLASLVQFSNRQCVTNMQFGDRTNASLAHNLLVGF